MSANTQPRSLIWPLLLIAAAALLATLLIAQIQSPVRVGLTFAFMLVAPGMAVVQWLRISDWLIELTLAVALSIALTTLTSELMIYSGLWSSQLAALGLIGWTIVGALIHLVRMYFTWHRTRTNSTPQPHLDATTQRHI